MFTWKMAVKVVCNVCMTTLLIYLLTYLITQTFVGIL